jgi:N-ethylmaleimide reductase
LLLEPNKLDPLGDVQSRVVMSAMTRGFADTNHCATPEIADYYGSRAADGVGLILTEGTIADASGDGYNNVPHIQTAEQTESWKQVTDRVHSEGGKIYSQLWHCGRISHSDFTGGDAPVSSTNEQAAGHNRQNDKPFGVPRALEPEEMPTIYEMFRLAARNAMDAGFDGVQVHGGHGYLTDQFFDARVNDRTDSYGGSVENRCRFGLELLETVLAELGPEKVMMRISPSRFMGELYDWPDLDEMINYLIPAFKSLGLRMLDISCANADYFETSGRIVRAVRPMWDGLIIGGASLTPDQAENEIKDGFLDMVTWGRRILSNPDFCRKIRNGESLQDFDPAQLKSLV